MEFVKDFKIADLKPFDRNPRHNDQAVQAVQKSIATYGKINPIIVNKDHVICAGHTRYKAAIESGIETFPVLIVPELDDEKFIGFNIADNQTASIAEFIEEELAALIQELSQLDDFDLDSLGFSAEELDAIMDSIQVDEEPKTDEDEIPADPPTRTKPGDIWQLGDHIVKCGEALSTKDLDTIIQDPIDMIFTDPPYNVNYEGKAGTIQNDNQSNAVFYRFLLSAFRNMNRKLKPGGCAYICHADTEGLNFRKAMVESGIMLKQCLIWVKQSAPISRQDYNWQHEPILYGWKPGAGHFYAGDFTLTTVIDDDIDIENLKKSELLKILTEIIGNTRTTVIRENRPLKSDLHPTMKPVSLVTRAIEASSRKGETVLDTFLGSGSTLIAAEKTKRKCIGMDIEPKWVDTTVTRWENYTGKKAEKIS